MRTRSVFGALAVIGLVSSACSSAATPSPAAPTAAPTTTAAPASATAPASASAPASPAGPSLPTSVGAGEGELNIIVWDGYAQDGSVEYRDFWQEVEKARVSYRPNRQMNFYVEPSQGHDDYLMSLALLAEAASALGGRPRTARGRVREAWS